jgi:glutamate--cysteine ligase catalytic subunit
MIHRALGTPLDWPEAKKNAGHVREWGIQQLLAIWNRAKGKERDALLWGDEVCNTIQERNPEERSC